MNQKILEHYENKVKSIIAYLNTTNVRKSLEDYRQEILKNTSSLEDEKDIEHNLGFINDFYETGMDVLNGEENKINKTVKRVVDYILGLKEDEIINSICLQLENSISKWSLNENYSSFNGLFFEHSDEPYYTGIAFKEEKFDVILNNEKSVIFNDGSYASNFAIEFQLAEIIQVPNKEEYEEIAWEFEYELEIFLKIKELLEAIVSICLHKTLQQLKIINLLEGKGFEKNGVVYLNAHESGEQTVFINE